MLTLRVCAVLSIHEKTTLKGSKENKEGIKEQELKKMKSRNLKNEKAENEKK